MKYVALLRGVNVGGKNPVAMTVLKDCFERQGFERVVTYIQSGNVIFETSDRNAAQLAVRIEHALSTTLGYPVSIVLQSFARLRTVIAEAPGDWKRGKELRCNVAFLRRPVTVKQALREVETKDGVDEVAGGKGVLYLSTRLNALTSSRFNRLVTTNIYRNMTIRTYNTCLKILALMEN